MTELHFKTTLLPSLPRKGKVKSKHCSDKESRTLQLALFSYVLHYPSIKC